MSVKNVTLYSLPYVVGVASILAVAQQAASPITSLGVSHKSLPARHCSDRMIGHVRYWHLTDMNSRQTRNPWQTNHGTSSVAANL